MAFSNYVALTVQSSQVTGTLSSFPGLVSHTFTAWKSAGNGGKVQNTDTGKPADLAFYSDSGLTTLLDFEVERWNTATGELIAWVKVSSIATSTVVYVGYNDAGRTTTLQNPAGVWDDYSAVYHFGDGVTLSGADATGNGRTGTPTGGTPTAVSTGIAGQMRMAGGNNTYVGVSDHADLQFGTGDFTVQAVVYPYVVSYGPTDQGTIFSKDYLGIETMIYEGQFGTYVGGTSNNLFNLGGATTVSANTRYWFGVRRTGSTISLTINGTSVASTTNSSDASNGGADVRWGNRTSDGGLAIDADMDEGRVAKGVYRSDAWMTAEYNNQSAPTSFWTLGSEQSVGGAPTSFLPGVKRPQFYTRRKAA